MLRHEETRLAPQPVAARRAANRELEPAARDGEAEDRNEGYLNDVLRRSQQEIGRDDKQDVYPCSHEKRNHAALPLKEAAEILFAEHERWRAT